MPAIKTRDQAEEAMQRLALLAYQQRATQASLDLGLAEIRKRHQPHLDAWAEERKGIEAALETWARANRAAEFGDRQSLDLMHGTLAYRVGQPQLKPLKGWTWDKITLWLLEHCPRYVRTTYAAQRDSLLADRDNLDLSPMGLRVCQAERFAAEPREETPRLT